MKKLTVIFVALFLVGMFGQNKVYIWNNNVITDSMDVTNNLKMTFKTGSTVTIPDTGATGTGLLAYFPFNNNANDESGNGNNGVVGGAVLTSDRFGNDNSAYHFTKGTYIEVPQSYKIEPKAGITCAAWVYPDSASLWGTILSKRYYDFFSPYNSYILGKTPDSKGWEFYSTNESAKVKDTADVKPLAWSFVVGTFDGTKNCMYVNGVKVAEVASTTPLSYTTLSLRIGTSVVLDVPHRYEQCFNGKIDDIRIYGHALSDDEINTLYSEGGWTGN
jgi:trimeric autotransporter adhesin